MPGTVTKLAIADARRELQTLLGHLTQDPGAGSSVTATVGDCYVQWWSEQGAISVEAAPAANERAPELLHSLGFCDPDAQHANYHKHVSDHARLQSLAEEGLTLLQQVYGVEADAIVELQASYADVWKPSNPALARALALQAERDDTRARSDVFFAFLSAVLLIPTEPGGEVSLLRSETGGRTLAAFTDTEALERLWPDGKSFTLMPPDALYPWVRDHDVDQLIVNQGGPIVCHLDRAQISALVAATDEVRNAVSDS